MKKFVLSLFLLSFTLGLVAAPSVLIRETIEVAAKVSGKSLSRSAGRTAQKALQKAMTAYGDDVARIVKSGGLESLQAGAKYGDDFWRICKSASPDTVRRFALHVDDWMPHIKRIGDDFIRLEEKAPGLGIKAVQTFGDDAVKIFNKAPADDLSRMIGYANKADSPAARKYLFETYKKGGTKFLDSINAKKILAGGLSIAAITAAYKISDGTAASLLHLAKHHPEKLLVTTSFWLFMLVLIVCFPLIRRIWKLMSAKKTEKKQLEEKKE
ncbi:MAG: hypothetical protein IKB25_05070 [Lentisphaeria bacterium]|nr:hypothetical protein [Lentisphaeria bacterium]